MTWNFKASPHEQMKYVTGKMDWYEKTKSIACAVINYSFNSWYGFFFFSFHCDQINETTTSYNLNHQMHISTLPWVHRPWKKTSCHTSIEGSTEISASVKWPLWPRDVVLKKINHVMTSYDLFIEKQVETLKLTLLWLTTKKKKKE